MHEQSTLSELRNSPWLSLRARIGMSCLFFLDAVLMMRKHFLRFEWAPWLSFGLYWLTYLQRQPGERWRAYLSKPQAVATIALLSISLGWFLHNSWAFIFRQVAH